MPGFPYPSNLPSFLHHSEVLKHLQDYTTHFDLHQYITCGMLVEKVTPLPKENIKPEGKLNSDHCGQFADNVKWMVTTKNLESGEVISEEYDAVLVCTG